MTEVISRRRYDWIVRPNYETVLYSQRLGAEVQLNTVTDQNVGHPHRVEVRVKTWPNKDTNWEDILPVDVFPYKTRGQALEDHEDVVEFFSGVLGRN